MKRFAFAFLCLCLLNIPAWATTTQVSSRGEGDSRELAIRAAQRSAVEQGLGVALQSETYIKDFVLQSDSVVVVSSGVVTSFDVISESTAADGMWSVEILAVVDSDRLQGNIDLLLSQLDNPLSLAGSDTACSGQGGAASEGKRSGDGASSRFRSVLARSHA